MRMKTSELSGKALDWAVAKCEGKDGDCEIFKTNIWYGRVTSGFIRYHPSTNRDQGYEIVEREGIHLLCDDDLTEWTASAPRKNLVGWRLLSWGPTPLIAAMRCYVASKLGEYVDVPDEMKS